MAFRLTPWQGKKSQNLPTRREERQDPFTTLQREMNRLFEDFGSGFNIKPFGEETGWMPRVNVAENDKQVTVTAELPGLEEKDIDLSLTDNVLTIKGEKRNVSEEKGQNFYRMERSFGSFERSIQLPAEVETDKVDASFKKGVLTVTLPKSKEAQKEVRKIEVKSS